MERTFLILAIDNRSTLVDNYYPIKGETLCNAILGELIANGGTFMYWDSEVLGEDTKPEEKAIKCVQLLEEGICCDTTIQVIDITDPDHSFNIFPTDAREKVFDELIIGTKFYINCWIPAYDNPNDRPMFTSMRDAETEIDQLRLMQPENIYRIEGE